MKVTVEISDALLQAARRIAASEGTTLRELIEGGLRQVLSNQERTGRFQLRKASFKGNGLQNGAKNASWNRLREMAY